jgi:hypothetical protein
MASSEPSLTQQVATLERSVSSAIEQWSHVDAGRRSLAGSKGMVQLMTL